MKQQTQSFGGKGMLAICEECSKKYNIDESKMKGSRARFSCQECGHIIVVVKGGTGQPQEGFSGQNSVTGKEKNAP
jgi:predicted Zn finger-like uncharacterized protein